MQFRGSKKKKKEPQMYVVVKSVLAVMVVGTVATGALAGGARFNAREDHVGAAAHSGRSLLTVTSFESGTAIAGWTIGWVSGLMYFTSRIPQIVKNVRAGVLAICAFLFCSCTHSFRPA